MNIYQTCFDLMNQYVYGGTVQPDTFTELVCILFSTAACLFVMSVPFIVVFLFIKFIVGLWR